MSNSFLFLSLSCEGTPELFVNFRDPGLEATRGF
jgi:hypothetical protein